MRAVGPGLELNHRHPLVDQSCVLARADVIAWSAAAGNQPVFVAPPTRLQPNRQGVSRGLGDLEWDWLSGFLLDDRGACSQRTTRSHVADTQLHQVIASLALSTAYDPLLT